MLWLKKLNFMETAKLEMELMKALDAGEDLDAKLENQRQLAESSGDAEQAWKAEVWDKMLQRIRKMESMLNPPGQAMSAAPSGDPAESHSALRVACVSARRASEP